MAQIKKLQAIQDSYEISMKTIDNLQGVNRKPAEQIEEIKSLQLKQDKIRAQIIELEKDLRNVNNNITNSLEKLLDPKLLGLI